MDFEDNDIYCYSIPCAACGQTIPLNNTEAMYTTFRLCDECIRAIKFAKN